MTKSGDSDARISDSGILMVVSKRFGVKISI
jgi:hypothetical protein